MTEKLESTEIDFADKEYAFNIGALEAHFARLAVGDQVEVKSDE